MSAAAPTTVVPLLPPGFLNETFGAVLIGVYASIALWGVTCCQTFLYAVGPRFAADPLWLKAFVFAAWALDTTQQALVCHVAYVYLVTNFGNVVFLGTVVSTIVTEVVFNALIALTVKLFYTHRIYILSESIPLTGLTFLFVIAEFVISLVYSAKAYGDATFAQITGLKALSLSVNAVGAAGDVLIAAVLCYILHNRKTGFKSTDATITKLMAFIINTGLLTAICALLSLITISARPNGFIYIGFYFCLGRLYTNSLLATLNARESLRSSVKDDYRMGTISSVSGMGVQRGRGRPEIDIRITQTTSYDPGETMLDVKRANSAGDGIPQIGKHGV